MFSHHHESFDEEHILEQLKHYLPSQAPLKDFVHHNTLHAFQNKKFYDALHHAAEIFGYKTTLSVEEYRHLYAQKKIREDILDQKIIEKKGESHLREWKLKLVHNPYIVSYSQRLGLLRGKWKEIYKIDLDSLVHPILFRIVSGYLDQGISIWDFPSHQKGFLSSLREVEKNSFTSFFKTDRVRKILLLERPTIVKLLAMVFGEEKYYNQYLFDQQFAHPGWSGMVSLVEDQPQTLLDYRRISLHNFIILELLLEIDALESELGSSWKPLAHSLHEFPIAMPTPIPETEYHEMITIWQDAFEWSYYDEVLAAIKFHQPQKENPEKKRFQALFCIDDREGSMRRHIENIEPKAETFGTPGFFGVEFYYKPSGGKAYTKLCPLPVNPKYLIKEVENEGRKRKKDVHLDRNNQKLLHGWFLSQTLGFWAAVKLFLTVFRPAITPATASSLAHMDKLSKLTILNTDKTHIENGLQIGFTIEEMAQRVEAVLKSIGLTQNFASLVYIIAHGSTTVNNPHYAAYDCGACSGRPGSVNARVFAYMANQNEVREILAQKDIRIPFETQFVGVLHDTTRDDFVYYDLVELSNENMQEHIQNERIFSEALDLNAKERARRFDSVDMTDDTEKIHEQIRRRSISLFEPRPEYNHATDALCIVGRRQLSRGLFFDRRSFFNSYNYQIDPDGKFLFNILKAVAPVCGGINLEYYFSRVDNQKLGVGTKLPLNVIGLIGVANGVDGDLRAGLPSQMVEIHDPVRLMVIVEHYSEIVLKTIKSNPELYEWFDNQWIHLVSVHPETRQSEVFRQGKFEPYEALQKHISTSFDLNTLIESDRDNNLHIHIID